ncbi:MAG: hypothetical protein CMK36_05145 [Porticoccaceae bacterium]|nr:hypothetical protein [Porticoccaceae bacterium]|tara:strand:+ start:1452 stop:2030 length:579 start_codon:yes stop_codon:yes gene_type:complete
MSASTNRLTEDISRLEELSRRLYPRLKIISKTGSLSEDIMLTGFCAIKLQLFYPTAPSIQYPKKIQERTDIIIKLLSRYPYAEPAAEITTPIYHPNVYASGKVCLGTRWFPSQHLDQLVKRIIQIITYDETILNESSVANRHALNWYKRAIKNYPDFFPTDKQLFKEESAAKISWIDLNSDLDQLNQSDLSK